MADKTKILILGGGFGGMYTALELEKAFGNDPGVEITLGRRTGVAKILGFKFSGFVAWWLWLTIYLSMLPRAEKKLRVTVDWTLDLFFSKDLVQFMPLRREVVAKFDTKAAVVGDSDFENAASELPAH